jgi:hypothetical protein
MARIAKKSKAKRVTKHTAKKAKHTPAKKAETDNVNTAMRHAVAQTLATAIDHMPFDLGYSFK